MRVLTQLTVRTQARMTRVRSDLTPPGIRRLDERSLSVRFSVPPFRAHVRGSSDPPVPPCFHAHPVGDYTEPNLSIPEGATHHG